jgi:hypothetical protein
VIVQHQCQRATIKLPLSSPFSPLYILPLHLPIHEMSYTAESLEVTLQRYDDLIKNGIINGDIQQVMKDIDSELVSQNNIHNY